MGKLAASSTLAGGLLRPVTIRSGCPVVTCTVLADAAQLFGSLLSVTTFSSSAQASTKYAPAATVLGTATVVVAVDAAPAASAATARVPVSRMSSTLFSASVDR